MDVALSPSAATLMAVGTMLSRGLCGLAFAILAAGVATGQEPRPLIEITPGKARALRVAVQQFALELPETAVGVPDPERFRGDIENAIAFSDVVLPLAREAFLGRQITQSLPDGHRWDCIDWTQSGVDALLEGRFRASEGRIFVDVQVWDPARCKRLSSDSYRVGIEFNAVPDLKRAATPELGLRAAGLARRIADKVVMQLTGTPGVAETEIVFISTRTGNSEVTVMNADGSAPHSATRGTMLKASPHWTPRGDAILYTAFPDTELPGLYLVSRGAVPPGRLRHHALLGLATYSGVYSPTPVPAPGRAAGELAIVTSLDGAAEIFRLDASGKQIKRLTHSSAIEVSPSWSPDGSQIAFVSDRSGAPQIYVMDRDGKHTRRVTFSGSYNTSPAWSPDGRWIAHETRVGRNIDIWLVDPTGQVSVPVVEHSRSDESPSWSPDSRKLAFSSNRRGRADIYVVDMDGQNLRRLTRDAGENTQPSWGSFPRQAAQSDR